MNNIIRNRGWIVTISGLGINLALGILFTWSIFKEEIQKSILHGGANSFNWELSSLNDPYSLCCLVFSFSMILGGKCQDKFGPRLTASIGGLLIGSGLILISQTNIYLLWLLGFGILVGIGIGFCFSSATPPAIKWFPSTRTGTIVGIVVSGFGFAGVYIAPLSNYLLNIWNLQNTLLFFGLVYIIYIPILSFFLIEPPKGYIPKETDTEISEDIISKVHLDYSPRIMIKSGLFYIVWILFFIGAGSGLMVISSISEITKKNIGEISYITVATLAIGNAGGRIIAGIISDKIGRRLTLLGMLLFQCSLMFLSIPIFVNDNSNIVLVIILSCFIGFNYGSNMSLFPSFMKDLWGLKHFGINYGLLFTAWGTGGFIMSKAYQVLYVFTGSYYVSFVLAGIILIFGFLLTFILKIQITKHNLIRSSV